MSAGPTESSEPSAQTDAKPSSVAERARARAATSSFSLRRVGIGVLVVFVLIGCGLAWMTVMPGWSHSGELPQLTPEQQGLARELEAAVTVLAGDIGPRNHAQQDKLELAAAWISSELSTAGWTVSGQEWRTRHSGKAARNIIADQPAGDPTAPLIIVGAHYDSVSGCPGANDNASGTAALLALARRLRDLKGAARLRLVAFTDEEPPAFWTGEMGSLKYARKLKDDGETVRAMLSIETIGCYSDKPGSQKYPAPFNLVYPSRGDFIGFVGNLASRGLARRCTGRFRGAVPFPSEGVAAPEATPGIGWSDHWSFWKIDVPAVMITDTAPFRYPHYHRPSDTPDKLDYERMARVVFGLEVVIRDLVKTP